MVGKQTPRYALALDGMFLNYFQYTEGVFIPPSFHLGTDALVFEKEDADRMAETINRIPVYCRVKVVTIREEYLDDCCVVSHQEVCDYLPWLEKCQAEEPQRRAKREKEWENRPERLLELRKAWQRQLAVEHPAADPAMVVKAIELAIRLHALSDPNSYRTAERAVFER